MTMNWNLEISLAEIIRIVILIVVIVGAYYKFDARLTTVERNQAETQQLMRQVNATVEQIQGYLSSRDPEYWWHSREAK